MKKKNSFVTRRRHQSSTQLSVESIILAHIDDDRLSTAAIFSLSFLVYERCCRHEGRASKFKNNVLSNVKLIRSNRRTMQNREMAAVFNIGDVYRRSTIIT